MARRISAAMARLLRNLRAGRPAHHGIFGRSAFGGLSATIMAAHRHHYLAGDGLTQAGIDALAEYEKAAKP